MLTEITAKPPNGVTHTVLYHFISIFKSQFEQGSPPTIYQKSKGFRPLLMAVKLQKGFKMNYEIPGTATQIPKWSFFRQRLSQINDNRVRNHTIQTS